MKYTCMLLVLVGFILPSTAATAEPARISAVLREQWRLSDSDDSLMIGEIVDVAIDAAGNTCLLDFKLQSVAVIGSQGELLRTIGGPGDGPGETRAASRLFSEPDGRMGLLDMVSSRLVWFDTSGRPLPGGHLRLNADGSGALATYDARRCAGGYVAAFMVRDEAPRSRGFQVALARVPDDGTAPVILYRVADVAASAAGALATEAEQYNFVWDAWDVGRAGTVYLAPDRDRPLVLVLPAGGGEPTEIRLVTGRRERTAAEKARVASRYAEQHGGTVPQVADADAFVDHLWCDELGQVWVHTPSSEPAAAAGVFLAYDVYTEAGEYLKRVDLLGPDDARRDNWFLLPGGRVVVVRNARDGESGEGQEVVGYSFGPEVESIREGR